MKKNFTLYLGNLLILSSLAGIAYIFFPIGKIYLYPPKIQELTGKNGTFITIKKINAQALISENVDPYNEAEYQDKLKNSVAHASGTSLPGTNGTSFIFAHSSGPPWEQTRYNTIFLRLNELSIGDTVEIQRKGKVHKYLVREKKEVYPQETKYLEDIGRNQLIIQTCTPIGTDLKRLLIFADPA